MSKYLSGPTIEPTRQGYSAKKVPPGFLLSRLSFGITAEVGLTLIIVFLLLIALVGFSVLQEAQRSRSRAQSDAQERSVDVAATIDGFLSSSEYMLSTLSALPAVKDQNSEELTIVLSELLSNYPQYQNIRAIKVDGWSYASAIPSSDGQPTYFGDQEYFQQAIQTGKIAICSIPNSSQQPTRFTITIAYPVFGDGMQINGIVSADFDQLPLNDIIRDLDLPAGSNTTIIDSRGFVIARSAAAEEFIGKSISTSPIWQDLQAKTTGVIQKPLFNEEDQLLAYSSVHLAPWRALVGIPPAIAYSQLGGDLTRQIAILIFPAFFIAYFALRLGRFAVENSRANETIRHQDEFLVTLIENSSIGIAVVQGPEHRFTLANDAFRTTPSGIVTDILGRTFDEVFPKDVAKGMLLKLETVYQTGRTVNTREYQGMLNVLETVYQTGSTVNTKEYEGTVDGRQTFWNIDFVPLQNGERGIEGVILLTSEVTEQVLARKKIEELKAQAELSLAQTDALLRSLGEAITIIDGSGQIVFRNKVAQETIGIPDKEALLRADKNSLRVLRLDETEVPIEDWPTNRLLRGDQVNGEEIILMRADGGQSRVILSSGSVLDEEGKVALAILVSRDVTELRHLEQMREEYTSLISHDLRNPLTVIKGQADWLQRSLSDKIPSGQMKGLEAITSNAQRMNAMIQDLVDTTRLESGRMEMHKEPTDISSLVARVAESIGSAEERARIQIESLEWVPPITVDASRIERTIMNLLTNALKYSSEGPVTVQVRQSGREALIAVTDKGVGIPSEDIPHLFERFFRAKTAQEAEGLGLGLYITRLIIEAHGGQIHVESEVGKGSTFTLALPLE